MPFGPVNQVNIEGNLTADARLATAGEQDVADFRIAVDPSGAGQTAFVSCSAFGRYGRALAGSLKRGVRVVVAGHLRGGGNGRELSVVADRVLVIDRPATPTVEDLAAFLSDLGA